MKEILMAFDVDGTLRDDSLKDRIVGNLSARFLFSCPL